MSGEKDFKNIGADALEVVGGLNIASMSLAELRIWVLQDWLSTFNTESATECFTAVQRLKESVDDRLDEGYKG